MKRFVSLLLCFALCLSILPATLAQGNNGNHNEDKPGAFTGFIDGNGDYIIGQDVIVTEENSVEIRGGSVTIAADKTLTIEEGGKVELSGITLTNNGNIIIKEATIEGNGSRPSNEGRLEVRDKGKIENHGKIDVEGALEVIENTEFENKENSEIKVTGFIRVSESKFVNSGKLIVDHMLHFENNSELENEGQIEIFDYLSLKNSKLVNKNQGKIDIEGVLCLEDEAKIDNKDEGVIVGVTNGRINLQNSSAPYLEISGLDFYEYENAEIPLVNPDGNFKYTAVERWVSDSEHEPGGNGHGHLEENEGAFENKDTDGDKKYIIDENLCIDNQNMVTLLSGSVIINENVTLTIRHDGKFEFHGVVVTNNGKIIVESKHDADPPNGSINVSSRHEGNELIQGRIINNGQLIVNGHGDFYNKAELVNNEEGKIEINGHFRFDQEAKLSNDGEIIVCNELCFENKSELENEGQIEIFDYLSLKESKLINKNQGKIDIEGVLFLEDEAEIDNKDEGVIIGVTNGRINLQNSNEPYLKISGLNFYVDKNAETPLENPDGEFVYRDEKWADQSNVHEQPEEPGHEDDDELYDIFIKVVGEGKVIYDQVESESGEKPEFTQGEPMPLSAKKSDKMLIEPGTNMMLKKIEITSDEFDEPDKPHDILLWGVSLSDDGDSLELELKDHLQPGITIEFTFAEETDTIEYLLNEYKIYAVLGSDEDEIKANLQKEFGFMGRIIAEDRITVTDFKEITQDYGSYKFEIDDSEETVGYSLNSDKDLLFEFKGEDSKGDNVDEIKVYKESDLNKMVISAPALANGTMRIFGVGDVIAARISEDVRDAFGDNNVVKKSFYRAQYHIFSRAGNLNYFGLDVIQEDAYCLKVEAESEPGKQQKNAIWDCNRYAILNKEFSEEYTSKVFFGNNKFKLSLPEEGIGAIETIDLGTGDFNGYKISEAKGTYTLEFLSDFYDYVTLKVDINYEEYTLNIHRVGVKIEEYNLHDENHDEDIVFHGTQYGSKIDYTEYSYQVFASYSIPVGKDVPYGLFAIYTWADGSITTKVITETVKNNPGVSEYEENEKSGYDSATGVYHHGPDSAAICDYLLYAGTSEVDAPVKINVTVLSGESSENTFGGVSFGSGRGVEWVK